MSVHSIQFTVLELSTRGMMKHNVHLKFLIFFGKGKPAGTNVSSQCKELSHLHLNFYDIAKVENLLLSKLQSSLSNSDVKIPHHHCTVQDGKREDMLSIPSR